jgi:O-antigen ligase
MSSLRSHWVAAAYASWLLAIFVVFYLVHALNETALQLVLVCGAIPAALQCFLLGIDWRGLVAPVKMWIILLLVILISYVVNVADPRTAPAGVGLAISPAWTPMVYTLNVVFITSIATLIAGSPDRLLLRSIASFYCIFATPFLVYIDLTGEMLWGRLVAGDLQPNNWGLMGLTVCVAALARRPDPFAIAGMTAGFWTIFLASSREHMLALAIVLVIVAVIHLRAMNRPRFVTVLATSCVALIVVAVLLDPYVLGALRYIGADVLLLNSPNRGLDSGFTGRTEIWSATIDLWLKSPLLGVGFRQHEQFLEGAPAHNAYLAMLADTGLVGFVWYVVLLVRSLLATRGIEEERTRRFVVAAIVGYIVVGFFDRRTINAGNPYGLLILMCAAYALAEQSLRKAARLAQANAAARVRSPVRAQEA